MIKLVDLLNEVDTDKCPSATQNIELNLQNRQKAIENQGYGPLNPNEPNENFLASRLGWLVFSLLLLGSTALS